MKENGLIVVKENVTSSGEVEKVILNPMLDRIAECIIKNGNIQRQTVHRSDAIHLKCDRKLMREKDIKENEARKKRNIERDKCLYVTFELTKGVML